MLTACFFVLLFEDTGPVYRVLSRMNTVGIIIKVTGNGRKAITVILLLFF